MASGYNAASDSHKNQNTVVSQKRIIVSTLTFIAAT